MGAQVASKQNGGGTDFSLESPQALNDCKSWPFPRDSSLWGLLCFFFDL